jgi:hypothetical protein
MYEQFSGIILGFGELTVASAPAPCTNFEWHIAVQARAHNAS